MKLGAAGAHSSEDWNIRAGLSRLLQGAGLVGMLAGLITVVLIVALSLIVATERKAVFDVARAELLGGQKVVAAHIGRTYQAARTQLLMFEEEVAVEMKGSADGGQRAGTLASMLRTFSRELITIRMVDGHGNIIDVAGDGGNASHVSPAEFAFFQAVATTAPGSVSYGSAIVGREQGTRVLPIGIRARGNTLKVVSVGGGLRASDFERTFDGLYVSAPGKIGIFNSDGVILATWPWSDALVGRKVPGGFTASDEGNVVVGELPSLSGQGVSLVGVSKLDGIPLYAFSAFEVKDLQWRWYELIWLPILVGVLSVAVVIVLSARVVRLMRQNQDEVARAREALEQASAASDAKKDFLANMSHELRTPLNGIIGFGELMEQEVFGALTDRYRVYAGLIVKSGRSLLEMIKEILELSRLDAGIVEVRDQVVDLPSEVNLVVMAIQDRIRERNLEITTHFSSTLPQIRMSRAHLKQVLTNLLSNAVKFNVDGGRVVIAGHCLEGEEFVIQVMDSGIGIPREKVAGLFVPFTQIVGSERRGHPGLGLGLAMSSAIVRAYGGGITIESDVGKGTTVYVTLPARLVMPNADVEQTVLEDALQK